MRLYKGWAVRNYGEGVRGESCRCALSPHHTLPTMGKEWSPVPGERLQWRVCYVCSTAKGPRRLGSDSCLRKQVGLAQRWPHWDWDWPPLPEHVKVKEAWLFSRNQMWITQDWRWGLTWEPLYLLLRSLSERAKGPLRVAMWRGWRHSSGAEGGWQLEGQNELLMAQGAQVKQRSQRRKSQL